MPAKVYYASLKNKSSVSPLGKIKKLIHRCGAKDIYQKDDLVAVKVHFGEFGNTAFMRPIYLRPVLETLQGFGAKPFLTDTNTLYVGMRNNSVSHLHNAVLNGFNYSTLQTPIIIADGLRGENSQDVPVPNGVIFSVARIASEILNADGLLMVSHFKGHEYTGFGGAIKNLSMGCASRAGKLAMHSISKPMVNAEKCTACGRCKSVCLWNAITISHTARITERCTGCVRCVGICPERAIAVSFTQKGDDLQKRMTEYAFAVVAARKKPIVYLNILTSIVPACDCMPGNDEPVVPDLGFMSSLDPVALDRASFEMIKRSAGGIDPFALKNGGVSGEAQLQYAADIGFGEQEFTLDAL